MQDRRDQSRDRDALQFLKARKPPNTLVQSAAGKDHDAKRCIERCKALPRFKVRRRNLREVPVKAQPQRQEVRQRHSDDVIRTQIERDPLGVLKAFCRILLDLGGASLGALVLSHSRACRCCCQNLVVDVCLLSTAMRRTGCWRSR